MAGRLRIFRARAAVLTAVMLLVLPVSAQSSDPPPLFVNTGETLYAVDPTDGSAQEIGVSGVIDDMRLSPDGAWLLVVSRPTNEAEIYDFHLIDTATLAVYSLNLRPDGASITVPYWRWDSAALLYTEYVPDSLRVVEYDIVSGQKVERAIDIPIMAVDDVMNLQSVVYWSLDGFALLQYDFTSAADVLPYDADGHALRWLPLSGNDCCPVNYLADLITVETDDGLRLAAYYPVIDQWNIIDPLTGTVETLGAEMTVALYPVSADDPAFALIVHSADEPPRNRNLAVKDGDGWRPFLTEPPALLSLSPDGRFYTALDEFGFVMTNGYARSLIEIPLEEDAAQTWRVVWSPLVCRIVPFGADGMQTNEPAAPTAPTPTPQLSNATFRDAALSPDGTMMAAVRGYRTETHYVTELVLIDALTLEATMIHSATGRSFFELPLWRWDSRGLLWPDYVEGEGARVVEYDLDTGELTVRTEHYPVAGDAGEVGMLPLVWWTPEGFAGVYGDLNGRAHLVVYDSGGTLVNEIRIADFSISSTGYVYDRIVPIETEGGTKIAVHYPVYGQGDVIDPLTGEITPQPNGVSLRLTQGVYQLDAHYAIPSPPCEAQEEIQAGDRVQPLDDLVASYRYVRPLRAYTGFLDPEQMYTVEDFTCVAGMWFVQLSANDATAWAELSRVEPVPPQPSDAYSAPLFISDGLATLRATDGRSEVVVIKGYAIEDLMMSPNNRLLLAWEYSGAVGAIEALWLIDTATLIPQSILDQWSPAIFIGQPVWSADSRRLLVAESSVSGEARLAEYDIVARELTVRASLPKDYPPRVVAWDDTHAILMGYDSDARLDKLIVYGADWTVEREVLLTGEAGAPSYPTYLTPGQTDNGMLLALYYHESDVWWSFDPRMGEFASLDGEIVIGAGRYTIRFESGGGGFRPDRRYVIPVVYDGESRLMEVDKAVVSPDGTEAAVLLFDLPVWWPDGRHGDRDVINVYADGEVVQSVWAELPSYERVRRTQIAWGAEIAYILPK